MITSVFKIYTIKFFIGRNFNTGFLSIYHFQDLSWQNSFTTVEKGVLFCVIIASVFITNFIVKKTD
jgi:hypothetical protein